VFKIVDLDLLELLLRLFPICLYHKVKHITPFFTITSHTSTYGAILSYDTSHFTLISIYQYEGKRNNCRHGILIRNELVFVRHHSNLSLFQPKGHIFPYSRYSHKPSLVTKRAHKNGSSSCPQLGMGKLSYSSSVVESIATKGNTSIAKGKILKC